MIDFNRVSLLEENLVTYQNQQAQVRGAIALGLIQTYRALGGGWWRGSIRPWKTRRHRGEGRATAGWARTHSPPAPVPLLDPNLEPRAIEPTKSSLRTGPATPSDPRIYSSLPAPAPAANHTGAAAGETRPTGNIAARAIQAIAGVGLSAAPLGCAY